MLSDVLTYIGVAYLSKAQKMAAKSNKISEKYSVQRGGTKTVKWTN